MGCSRQALTLVHFTTPFLACLCTPGSQVMRIITAMEHGLRNLLMQKTLIPSHPGKETHIWFPWQSALSQPTEGCILSPLLFSVNTKDRTSKGASEKFLKFQQDNLYTDGRSNIMVLFQYHYEYHKCLQYSQKYWIRYWQLLKSMQYAPISNIMWW